MSEPIQAVVLRRFSVSAERVFDAWLDVTLLGRWIFGPAVRDERIVRIALEPKVGGQFSFVVNRQGTEVDHVGEYLEIDRPRLLVFTWATRDTLPDKSRVIVKITQLAHGCDVTVTHVMNPEWSAFVDKAAGAWTKMLHSLDRMFTPPSSRQEFSAPATNVFAETMKANEQSGKFTTPAEVRLVRTLPGPIERVWAYLTDPEKRARWFAGGAMELRPGGKVTFLIRHENLAPDEIPPEEHKESQDSGRTMSGTVTRCEPPRVLAFTFDHYGQSEATFELTPQGKNVLLVLTHRGTGGDLSYMSGFGAGWHTHLAHLIALLEGAPRPPFWSLHARLKEEYDRLYAAALETKSS